MKVKTMIMLDEDVKKVVQAHLAKTGVSMSGFINALMVELAREINGQPVMLDKKVEDLTIKEFGELANYWFKKASGDE